VKPSQAVPLLASLLARIRADAKAGGRYFAGLVSEQEREALETAHSLLRNSPTPDDREVSGDLEHEQAEDDAGLTHALTEDGESGRRQAGEGASHGEGSESAGGVLRASFDHSESPAPARVEPTVAAGVPKRPIVRTALARQAPDAPEVTLCLDFGTAKSKAFCGVWDREGPRTEWLPLDLSIGTQAQEGDGNIYSVTSSMWLSPEGSVYVGWPAVEKSLEREGGRRLDSVKERLAPAQRVDFSAPAMTCSGESLTLDEALTFYLGFLTDAALSILERKYRYPRLVRRRFSLPCWPLEHRLWLAAEMRRRVAAAQIVADTFSGAWQGNHAETVREVVRAALADSERVDYLVDRNLEARPDLAAHWGAVLEPLAAGSGRIHSSRVTRKLCLVIDVGAGTTDIALFMVMPGPKAFPVSPPSGISLPLAGNEIDRLLLDSLVAQAGAIPAKRDQAKSSLALRIRPAKEELFREGRLELSVPGLQTLSMQRDEFLATTGMTDFGARLRSEVEGFLSQVDNSFWRSEGSFQLVLTGGGTTLPMVRSLANDALRIGRGSVQFSLEQALPDGFSNHFGAEFETEFPQLAVAFGGASPLCLDEGAAQARFFGDAPPPGPLERVQTGGL